jgi:hypothetical protein
LEPRIPNRTNLAELDQSLWLRPGEKEGKAPAVEAGKMAVIEIATQNRMMMVKSRSSRTTHDVIVIGSRNTGRHLGCLPTYAITSSTTVWHGIRGPAKTYTDSSVSVVVPV